MRIALASTQKISKAKRKEFVKRYEKLGVTDFFFSEFNKTPKNGSILRHQTKFIRDTLAKCKERGIDWMVNVDDDELLHSLNGESLTELAKRVPGTYQAVHFDAWEFIPKVKKVKGYYPDGMFKTREHPQLPLSLKWEGQFFRGHIKGKYMVRSSITRADKLSIHIAFRAKSWIDPNWKLLHYHITDRPDFDRIVEFKKRTGVFFPVHWQRKAKAGYDAVYPEIPKDILEHLIAQGFVEKVVVN